jgi:flagellar motility protein MotE (MotC chaperone)
MKSPESDAQNNGLSTESQKASVVLKDNLVGKNLEKLRGNIRKAIGDYSMRGADNLVTEEFVKIAEQAPKRIADTLQKFDHKQAAQCMSTFPPNVNAIVISEMEPDYAKQFLDKCEDKQFAQIVASKMFDSAKLGISQEELVVCENLMRSI